MDKCNLGFTDEIKIRPPFIAVFASESVTYKGQYMNIRNYSPRAEMHDKSKGMKLKSVLKAKGITQRRVARMCGLSEQAISKLCKGTSKGYLATWIKLSRVLQVPVEELLEL